MIENVKIIQEDDSKITPMSLLSEGRGWLRLFEYGAKDSDRVMFMPALYCLFASFEMYLKGYIVLKDSTYSDPAKLRVLGHSFNAMYQKIHEIGPKNMSNKAKTAIKHYNLFEIDITNLKYPKSQRMILFDRNTTSGKHIFKSLYDQIELEIRSSSNQWLEEVYPREISSTLMASLDFDGDVNNIDINDVVSLCHDCRPKGLIAYKSINYPWNDEIQPPEKCKRCGKLFNAFEMGTY